MNLLLLEQSEIDADGHAQLDGPRARHMKEVLQVHLDSAVRIGVLDGPVGRATVVALTDAAVTLRCDLDDGVPARPAVDLLLAVPRPKVLRRLWPQLAALGVGRVILTNAERVERPYFDTHLLLERNWRPLLIEGLQQARDTRLPLVSIHRRFRVLIEDELDALSDTRLRIVAEPGTPDSVRSAVAARFRSATSGDQPRALLAVGPEGGWNRFELDLLQSHGFVPAGLGPRTLRSDTACVAVLALVHAALHEAAGPQGGASIRPAP